MGAHEIPPQYAQRAALSIAEVSDLTGLGRGGVLGLLRSGELAECSLGGRKLILAASLWRALCLKPEPEPDADLTAEVALTLERYDEEHPDVRDRR